VKTQPQITFLNTPPNEAVEALIRENVAKLGKNKGDIPRLFGTVFAHAF
jgi:hypothetical protein